MENIYIVGFMGCGKSTIARGVSQVTGREFIDMDEVIEVEAGQAIVDIFKNQGEGAFRQMERALLLRLAIKDNLIVSCGGGLICNQENIATLKESGTVICLKSTPETIFERTKKFEHRPLLNVENPIEKIRQLLVERSVYYEQSDYLIDNNNQSLESVISSIVTIINI